MITLSRPRLALSTILVSCALITGCSSLSSGGSIREKELEIVPTESSVSFSRTTQGDIARLGLSAEQLGDPTALETNEQVATVESAAQRSLLLSEAWYLRGQNDLDVPLPESLERFLRAAHYSYEGIFGESGCQDGGGQLCTDLTAAYNRAVREVARLTNNGAQPPSPGDTRYIVDLQADNDPLTLSDWEVIFDDNTSTSAVGALGAAGAGCQTLANDANNASQTARQCIPLTFLVTFDERTTDDRARAHLAAFNTVERSNIQLHSRAVPLASSEPAAWTEIFAPGEQPLSCLGNAHPSLPTVLFLTQNTQNSSEWPVIGSAVAKDPILRDHFNFCAFNVPSVEPSTPQHAIDSISGALATLMPNLKAPAQIIVIAQGPQGDAIAKAIKSGLKGSLPGSTSPVAVAGTLSFPAPPPLAENTLPIPISSTTELSRSGTLALSDTKRLLSRLVHEDDGALGGLTRSSLSQTTDERLSPVM